MTLFYRFRLTARRAGLLVCASLLLGLLAIWCLRDPTHRLRPVRDFARSFVDGEVLPMDTGTQALRTAPTSLVVDGGQAAGPSTNGQDATGTPGDRTRRLLNASDFSYRGTYLMRGGDDVFGEGLTHRYVNGTLRLIYLGYAGAGAPNVHLPVEATLPEKFGQPLNIVHDFHYWNSFWNPRYWNNNLCHTSLWWEEGAERIWSGSGFDYPQGGVSPNETVVLATRTLPDHGGACENFSGFFGFEGIGQRALWGKVQKVPSWFMAAHATGEYVSLSGGYTSLMAQGLGPALGPMFVFFPALHGNYPARNGFGEPFNVPATDIKIGADTRSGSTATDWYSEGFTNRSKERGVRITPITNYFDGGDPRQNPSSRPDFPPVSGAGWLSPAPGDPDGYGRWTWGDSYHDTGNWIDDDNGTRSRHGIVLVASLNKGACWYQQSAGRADASALELHVYDPADVAKVLQGTLSSYKIRPAMILPLTNTDVYLKPNQNPSRVGATFDAKTSKLYIMNYFGAGDTNYLHEYHVAGGR